MKKIIFVLSVLIFSAFVFTRPALAAFKIAVSAPPEYTNREDLRIYYTYLETDGKTAKVNLYVQKEGKDWRQTKDKDKTAVSGYFQLEGSDFYNGDGKYHFYAKAWVEGVEYVSSTVTTTFDRSAPGQVTDYSKAKKDELNYEIRWRNPSDSDYQRVHIYRSREKSFTADTGTKVGEAFGAPGEYMKLENGSLEDKNAEYFYAIIAFDRAGNHSGIVTDAPGEVVPGEVLGTETELGTGGPLTYDSEIVTLPEEEEEAETKEGEEGQLGGGISTEAGEVMGDQTEKTSKTPYFLAGLGALVVLTFSYFKFIKRNKRKIRV